MMRTTLLVHLACCFLAGSLPACTGGSTVLDRADARTDPLDAAGATEDASRSDASENVEASTPDSGRFPDAEPLGADAGRVPEGCSMEIDEIVEPSLGGCDRASLALGTGERPHVAWSAVDGRGSRTEGGYSRRSDAGWQTERPFGIAHHVSLDVDGEEAFVLTLDADARAILWAGPTMSEVARFVDTTRRGPTGDGLLVQGGVAHVLLGRIGCAVCAGGEGVDHFRAVRGAGGLGAFTLEPLSTSGGSWPYALHPAPSGEPMLLFKSGDGFNYLQRIGAEAQRVSGDVTGPDFGLPVGGQILVTRDGLVHLLATSRIDDRPGGIDHVLLTQTAGGWARTSVARAPRSECPPALTEGETCAVENEQWNAMSLVAEAEEPVVVLAHSRETGTLTWACEEVCGAGVCAGGGCCRGACRWRGETTSSHELVMARPRESGIDTYALGGLRIGAPHSIDAAAGAGGAVHLAIAERTGATDSECSMRYLRLRCAWPAR